MRHFSREIFFIFIIFLLYGCYTVPVTNRPTLVLALPGTDELLGNKAFKTDLIYGIYGEKSNQKYKNDKVTNICSNLIDVANSESEVHWKWEIAVVENPKVNACCYPGGKIIVLTGLIDESKSDDEIAAVIGHEIAHALARHSIEQITFNTLATIGCDVAYALVNPKYAHWIYLGQMLSPFIFKYYERYHEAEADHIGLILMAKAGYNPNKAIDFWKRQPDYGHNLASAWAIDFITLRSHPSATERVARLEGLMDEANKFYASAPIKRSQQTYASNTSIASTKLPSSNIPVKISKITDTSANSLKKLSESKDNSEDYKEKDNIIESTSD